MTNKQSASPGPVVGLSTNDLLTALPENDFRTMVGTLRPMVLPKGRLIQRQGERFDRVCLPGSGLYSVRKVMADGRTIELAKIGLEGVIAPSVLADNSGLAIAEVAVLVQDVAAVMIGSDVFGSYLERSAALRDAVGSYRRTLLQAIAQSGACNGIHSVEERLCLGLLVACDRMGLDEIPLTQDSFARALAVRRPTISLVMNSLQKAGLVECARGKTRLLSRAGLEAISCECYATLRGSVGAVGGRRHTA
jgi:CRP-like cAMP-binding protein